MLIESFVDSMKVFSSFFEVFYGGDYQIVNFVLRNIGFVDSRGSLRSLSFFCPTFATGNQKK